jgi:N4-gp56 family major capsid protein
MAQTNVASGSNLALTQYSVALTAQLLRAPGNLNALTGPAPKQSDAERTIKLQTDPGMPFVRIADLGELKGDKVTVDAFDVVGGKPIMGDRNAEGQGKKLSSSSFEVKIDLATHNVDAGGKMSRQRTRHDLRRIAKANVAAYFPRFVWQRALVHLAGARGSQSGASWDVPLSTDADFADIMVNTVKAPTYNRHLVVNAGDLTRGGLQAASLATTDVWKLSVLDNLAFFLDSQETRLQPPRFAGDEQAYDTPLKGVLMLPPGSYNSLITDISSSTSNLRAYQAAAQERAKYAKNHPIFMGEAGIWRGILVKKIDYSILFNASDTFKYITVANRLTETETDGTMSAALSTTHVCERALLLGAQALARAEGASNSGVQASIIENTYNAGRNYEYLGEFMGGEAKFRFQMPNTNGDKEYTDHGVYVIDAAAVKRA